MANSKEELNGKLLPELKVLAKEKGIDTTGLKKGQIVDALTSDYFEDKGNKSDSSKGQGQAKQGSNNENPQNDENRNNQNGQMKNFEKRDRNNSDRDRNNDNVNRDKNSQKDGGDDRNLRRRDRNGNRNRNNRDRDDRPQKENYSEEEKMPIAGIVDIMDNFGFVRTSGYSPMPDDIFISGSVLKQFGLRAGDAIVGTAVDKLSKFGENIPKKGPKFNPLVSVESVNGMTVDEALKRPKFKDLTALYPTERLTMELPVDDKASKSTRSSGRLIDLLSPLGKGQRALIVAPPKAGKTIMMQNIANSISKNNPEVHLMVVLVDERPEEVTDMRRSVKGEVLSSTFDMPASEHTAIAELAIERAKRLVEMKKDVVILLDSITRLARAYNYVSPVSGRVLSGGVDAAALYPPKKFLGAARNVEEGGSLTIIASALVETGSKMDEVIFEEFKGTGNSEIKLSRELADKRIFPAIDVNASGTRREEWLLDPQELNILQQLHRALGDLEEVAAIEWLLKKFDDTKSNLEFLLQVSKTVKPK
jgi:transcription termination factor Rho